MSQVTPPLCVNGHHDISHSQFLFSRCELLHKYSGVRQSELHVCEQTERKSPSKWKHWPSTQGRDTGWCSPSNTFPCLVVGCRLARVRGFYFSRQTGTPQACHRTRWVQVTKSPVAHPPERESISSHTPSVIPSHITSMTKFEDD